ncbi:MAG: hypothetical protein DRH26_12545, partial [Deltaproteobacteria bacterium]
NFARAIAIARTTTTLKNLKKNAVNLFIPDVFSIIHNLFYAATNKQIPKITSIHFYIPRLSV